MEITYVENAWHVFSAFSVFLIGLVAFSVQPFRSVPARMSVALYLWHTVFCLYYARFAIYNTADARGYFIRSLDVLPSLTLGTQAVDVITSVYTQFLGLSYLGTFLVYNIIGAIGLLAFAAAIRETLGGKSRRVQFYLSVLLFLPGLSFWSVAIGKDAPALMGTGLLCWAALDMRRRWIAIVLGVAVYVVVRPHIAAVILVALAMAIMVSGKVSTVKKIMIIAVLAAPSAFAIRLAISTIGLGDSGAFIDVGDLIEYRQSVNMGGGGAINISGLILPVQMFLYAFGPLFIGAGSLMGLVASLENAFLLFLVASSAVSVVRRKSCLNPTVKWFYLFFALSLWIVFALTTANLGIALRQKWMFMPMLLIFCLSYLPEKRATSDAAGASRIILRVRQIGRLSSSLQASIGKPPG